MADPRNGIEGQEKSKPRSKCTVKPTRKGSHGKMASRFKSTPLRSVREEKKIIIMKIGWN